MPDSAVAVRKYILILWSPLLHWWSKKAPGSEVKGASDLKLISHSSQWLKQLVCFVRFLFFTSLYNLKSFDRWTAAAQCTPFTHDSAWGLNFRVALTLSLSRCQAEDGQTSRTHMGTERALLLDRLASNVAKRKSSMPQKFTGKSSWAQTCWCWSQADERKLCCNFLKVCIVLV